MLRRDGLTAGGQDVLTSDPDGKRLTASPREPPSTTAASYSSRPPSQLAPSWSERCAPTCSRSRARAAEIPAEEVS